MKNMMSAGTQMFAHIRAKDCVEEDDDTRQSDGALLESRNGEFLTSKYGEILANGVGGARANDSREANPFALVTSQPAPLDGFRADDSLGTIEE
jgi:hypothetical protein